MRERIDKGAAWLALLAIVGSVFGMLVWAAFGRDHTKTVVQTKTRTVVVTKRVAGRFDGKPQTLANYLQPQTAAERSCPKGMPKGAKCFDMAGQKFYVFLAVPSSS